MVKFKYILGVAVTLMATVVLHAQTYNDSVRTHTWSIYVQGGISNYHGVRSDLFDNGKRLISPDLSLGVKYNLKPWVRLGVNAGYTMLKAINKDFQSFTTTENGYLIDGKAGALTIISDRLQNQNNTNVLGLDANVDFNILQLWPRRKAQWLTLYAGAGVGYMHGWNRSTLTWSVYERAVAEGDGYNNVYTHPYMTSSGDKKQFNALYVPLSLSLEFDVMRQLTLGVIGQYKYIPMKADFSPKGIYSAGIVVRYNFVASKSKLQRKQIANLYSQLDNSQADCAKEKTALKRQSGDEMDRLKKQADDLKRQVEDMRNAAEKKDELSTVIYFDNNSYDLSEESCGKLKSLVAYLKANPEKEMMVISSANTVGYTKRNKKLSDNRLDAVKQYLISEGVSNARFKTEVSLGDSGMTDSSDCRRVLVVVQP